MRRPPLLFVIVGAAAILLACPRREERHRVERLEVPQAGVGQPDSSLGPRRLEEALTAALRAEGHFDLPAGSPQPPPDRAATPVRITLDLDLTDEGKKANMPGRFAMAGALLRLKVAVAPPEQYEVFGKGEALIDREEAPAVEAAVGVALKAALADAVAAAHLQLVGARKKDSELIKDLRASDVRVQRIAARLLAERKNPAALAPLTEQLKSEGVEDVRRAIGGLVELRDPRAGAPLIELARAKEASFLREIIFALGAIGGDEAEAYLYTLSQGHDDPQIRSAAEQAFQELRARSSSKRPAGENDDTRRRP